MKKQKRIVSTTYKINSNILKNIYTPQQRKHWEDTMKMAEMTTILQKNRGRNPSKTKKYHRFLTTCCENAKIGYKEEAWSEREKNCQKIIISWRKEKF